MRLWIQVFVIREIDVSWLPPGGPPRACTPIGTLNELACCQNDGPPESPCRRYVPLVPSEKSYPL